MKLFESKQLITGVVFGLFVGYIFGAYGQSIGGIFKNVSAGGNATTTAYEVSATDQGAGDIVIVDSVTVPKTAWVAVRENNYDVMGRILGAQKVTPGTHYAVSVELLRPTAPNVMYATVLYEDNGDDQFDFKTDKLVEFATGTPILSRFVTR